MNKDNEKRLIRFILISWTAGIVAGLIVIAYFSYEISRLKNIISSQGVSTTQIQDLASNQNKLMQQIESIALMQGPKGDRGEDGKNSVSTHTTVERQTQVFEHVPIQGKSAYELAVEDGFVGTLHEWLLSLKGEAARPIEPCRFRETLEVGWRITGTNVCLPVEVEQ